MLKKMKIRPSCKSLDGFFITLAIVSVLMLLYSTFYTYRATAEKNIKEQEIESFFDDCDAIKSASDLFTNEAKLFVIDNDLSHLNTYWEEAEKTQSVENAINHIKESGKSLSTLSAVMKKYPQYTINLTADTGDKATFLVDSEIKREIAEAEEKIRDGRLVIRPSGTEPLIRIMAEGEDSELIKKICHDLSEKIKERIEELKKA
jgi:phosphomannomutase